MRTALLKDVQDPIDNLRRYREFLENEKNIGDDLQAPHICIISEKIYILVFCYVEMDCVQWMSRIKHPSLRATHFCNRSAIALTSMTRMW